MSQCPSCGGDCGYGPLRHCQQGINHETAFRNGVTASGNCDLCFLKGGAQILSLIAEKPERAIWWAAQETIGTFRTDRPSYASMLQFTKEQVDMFDPNEQAISCFCGD